MSKSFSNPDPEDLVLWAKARIGAIYYPEGPKSRIPYFEVEREGETLRVRFTLGREDIKEWLEGHQDVDVDLVIFPFHWKVKESSGIVYYLRSAVVTETH